MKVAQEISPRRRNDGIRQSDIARAIRGAMQAGMDVREVIATKDGIRILSGPGAPVASASSNSWDAVLDNG